MTTHDDRPVSSRLHELTPFLSVTVLECTEHDPHTSFDGLIGAVRAWAREPVRGVSPRILHQEHITEGHRDVELLPANDVEGTFVLVRARERVPGWAAKHSAFRDVSHELVVAVRHRRLVAVRMDTDAARNWLLRWAHEADTPYRCYPGELLTSAFQGDSTALWLKAVNPPRPTQADTKAFRGMRLQDFISPDQQSGDALRAVEVDHVPNDANACLRGKITLSAARSNLSFKAMSTFRDFAAAVGEALAVLAAVRTADQPPVQLFPQLAQPETDLGAVRGAYEVLIAEPDEHTTDPDEDTADRRTYLHQHVLGVRGEPDSPHFTLDLALPSGELSVAATLREHGGGVRLDVDTTLPDLRWALGRGDLLDVYYDSGHAYTGHLVARHNETATPFDHLLFVDFGEYVVTKEKPSKQEGKRPHELIARDGDDSLFAWIVDQFRSGWLLCDDGSGEVADFLHLAADGALTAIHLKAAKHDGRRGGISANAFVEVLSQAVKNARGLAPGPLRERLARRPARSACWWNGRRSSTREPFLDRLDQRSAAHATRVMVVQPQLRRRNHDRVRRITDPQHADVQRLQLLDNILHNARGSITALGYELIVVGAA